MVFAALSLSSLPGPAFGQVAGEEPCDEAICVGGAAFKKMLEYYRTHAHVRLGREKRLSNGVAWRLLIDTPTGLAVPRITWMPDGLAMRKANRLFDAIQGQELFVYAGQAAYWREVYEEAAREGEKDKTGVSLMIPRDNFIGQPMVALTYATSRLVSYFDVTILATDGMSKVPQPNGRILDLEQGKVFSIESCPEKDESSVSSEDGSEVMFRLGNWLEVCDLKSVARFLALYATNLEAATKSAAFRRDPYAEYCKESLLPLGRRAWDFEVYLTTTGLAVHASNFSSHMGRNCLRHESAVIPVIIPYRDLEPFMKPGPWRDELLR